MEKRKVTAFKEGKRYLEGWNKKGGELNPHVTDINVNCMRIKNSCHEKFMRLKGIVRSV